MDYFKFLPEEMTLEILTRLPTESVLECKSVCTNWRSILRHPSFSKMHLHHLNYDDSGELGFLAIDTDETLYYFEYSDDSKHLQRIRRFNMVWLYWDPSFVDSYNGLICFAGGPFVWICNPKTKEIVLLPEIEKDCWDIHGWYIDWTMGFGYLPSTDEYKIVRIYTAETKFVEVYIYTLGSGNGWRNLGKFNFESSEEWAHGTFANGSLYWLDRELDAIISFDLAKEKFSENISPPPLPHYSDENDATIGVSNGFLYFAVGDGSGYYDIWIMKSKSINCKIKEQEEHQSSVWSKEFRIDKSRLFAVTKSGGILTYVDNYLNIYDAETSTSKRLVEFFKKIHQISPHKNTFVSLKELGEDDTKTMKSIKMEETKSHDYSLEQLQNDANPGYIRTGYHYRGLEVIRTLFYKLFNFSF